MLETTCKQENWEKNIVDDQNEEWKNYLEEFSEIKKKKSTIQRSGLRRRRRWIMKKHRRILKNWVDDISEVIQIIDDEQKGRNGEEKLRIIKERFKFTPIWQCCQCFVLCYKFINDIFTAGFQRRTNKTRSQCELALSRLNTIYFVVFLLKSALKIQRGTKRRQHHHQMMKKRKANEYLLLFFQHHFKQLNFNWWNSNLLLSL